MDKIINLQRVIEAATGLGNRDRLLEISNWDEKFVGWGGEDQDIIERYLQDGRFLSLCPELVYLHLPHSPNQHWTETAFVHPNRQHYYTTIKSRRKDD